MTDCLFYKQSVIQFALNGINSDLNSNPIPNLNNLPPSLFLNLSLTVIPRPSSLMSSFSL